MMNEEHIFSEFSPVSKEEWLNKVIKDLKGRPLEALHWQLDEQLSIPPFYHPDEVTPQPPVSDARLSNDWLIGEYIDVEASEAANTACLEGLNGGVEAPLFRLFHPLDKDTLGQLLNNIEPTFVSLNFGEYYPHKAPGLLFDLLDEYFTRKQLDPAKIRASIDFDPLLDWSAPPMSQAASMIKRCEAHYPSFRPLQINGNRFHGGVAHTTSELAYIIAKGNEYLNRLMEEGIAPATANQHMQFGIAIGKSFFVEIAKIRALKILWANILKAHHATAAAPFIVAHLSKDSQDEQINTNMIRASTQAMSAVIGGINMLYVLPSDYKTASSSSSFHRRIARNVQHLLKMESYLDKVIDPGAGSYYIEQLTNTLAEQAWAKFVQLDQEGAFR
jgi:methylmalonyl-CoA mutase